MSPIVIIGASAVIGSSSSPGGPSQPRHQRRSTCKRVTAPLQTYARGNSCKGHPSGWAHRFWKGSAASPDAGHRRAGLMA